MIASEIVPLVDGNLNNIFVTRFILTINKGYIEDNFKKK